MALALITVPLVFRQPEHTQWSVVFDSADAGFYQKTWEEPATNLFGPKFVSRARVLYVLKVFSRTEVPSPGVLGTNTLQLGDRLYDPATRRELWRVLAIERRHEFEDGTDRDGVLVTSCVTGGEAWLPREKLGKVLVGR